MESSSEEKKTPRKSTRTRTRARRGSVNVSEKPERKSALKKPLEVVKRKVAAPKPEVVTPDGESIRKAPTPFSFNRNLLSKKRKRTIVASLVMLVGVGASAVVGFTDSGQIDVQKTIEERNARIRNNNPDERDVLNSTVEVPVQNTNSSGQPPKPLKGLGIGSGNAQTPPPEPDVSTSTASSTDQTATSTEEVIETSADSEVEDVASEESNESETTPEVLEEETNEAPAT